MVGPTAIGKTALGIKLAQHYHTDVISADSRQFFKEMTIGTAVPSKDELEAVKHHFIQHISIHNNYSVGDFERDAIELLQELFNTHQVVVLVGGSGLYVDAVTKGLDHFPDIDSSVRERLNSLTLEELQEKLKESDPEYFEKVDIYNPHRLIRALEVCIGSGKPYSSFLNKRDIERSFKTIFVGLEAERSSVYDRINRRVDIMIKHGLLDEVKELFMYKNLNALQTVGYREFFDEMEGILNREQAIEEVKKNTRRFAKRQLTWFRKNREINWFNYDTSAEEIIHQLDKLM